MQSSVVDRILWVVKGQGGSAAAAQTLLVRVAILGVNTVTGIITARGLGPDGRGEQAAMSALLFLLPSALVYNIKRHPEKQSDLFSAALVMALALGGLASLIGIFLLPIWLKHYSVQAIYLGQWFMLCAPIITLMEVIRASLEASERFSVANQLRFLPPISTLLILVVTATSGWLTPFTANLAYLLPGIPILLCLSVLLRSVFEFRLRCFRSSSLLLLSYGVRSYGIDLLTSLLAQFQQLLVVNLLVPKQLGMYAVALSLATILNIIQSSVVSVLFPKSSARPITEVVQLTARAARISAILTLIAAFIAMLIGPALLGLLYGKAYLEAATIFRLALLEVVIGGTTMILAQAFMALGRPGTVAVLQGIGVGLNLPLMMILIPKYGLVGAGLAILTATSVRLISVLLCFPLILKVRLPSLIVTFEDIQLLKKTIFYT
jgi:O-antigen/teichoic acid export membrane protein